MNKILQKIILFVLIIGISSCSRTYKIDKEDFELIPYSGKENLVFKSSENEMDTIFLKGFNRYVTHTEQMTFFPDKFEFYDLHCKRSDPNYNRYFDGKTFVQLVSSSENETFITFDIKMKGSWFYGKGIYSKSEFDSVPITKLIINNKTYNDVKIFESDGSYKKRDNYTERFYWSLSEGFLGLDKRETEWRLINKYVP